MAYLEFLAGAVVLAAVLYDVFEAIEVPRDASRSLRLTPFLIRSLWPLWRWTGLRFRTPARCEGFLGAFAPLAVLGVRLVWLLALTLGYGLIIHALKDQFDPSAADWKGAFYLAGCCLLTFGPNGFAAVAGPAQLALLTAGVSGLAVVSMLISLMFTLYGQLHRREALVLTLDARAGTPFSGVRLLETYGDAALLDDLPATFAAWETWSAEMVENHAAYPVLPYFRSAAGNRWIGALASVLDAATLLLTTIDAEAADSPPAARRARGAARLMHPLASRVLLDLCHRFGLKLPGMPRDPDDAGLARAAGVPRSEFVEAHQRLSGAGYPVRDAEEAWPAFARCRGGYAPALTALARHLATPPFHWLAERSAPPDEHGSMRTAAEGECCRRPVRSSRNYPRSAWRARRW